MAPSPWGEGRGEGTTASFDTNQPICLSRFYIVLAIWLLPLSALAQDASFENELKLIDGLRSRQLYSLADAHCDTLLSKKTDAITSAAVTIEQIKIQVARGISSSGDGRNEFANRIDTIADQFESQYPTHSRRLLVKVQQAAGHQTFGSLLVQEIAAEILGEPDKPVAQEQLRIATSGFKKIESTIDKLIPEHRSRKMPPDELAANQLINLKQNVRYQLAKTNLIKAGLYGQEEKLNKADALSQVMQRLSGVLRQTKPEQNLWWQASLDRVKCQRLLGNLSAANSALSSTASKEIPDQMQAEFLEERIRIATAAGGLNSANDLLAATESIAEPTPEMRLAMLQMAMAVAASGQETEKWQSRATELTKKIESTNGPYWGRRAELLLIGKTGGGATVTTSSSSSLDTLVRVGNAAVRKKNFADAVKAFDRAAIVAGSEKNLQQQLVLTVRSAQAHEQLKQYTQAAIKLTETSLQFSKLELAPSSHLRGCWNWSQTNSDNEADKNQRFQQLLAQHIETWPNSPTVNQARMWLGNFYQSQQQHAEAIETYLSIDLASPSMLAAAGQIAPAGSSMLSKFQTPEKSRSAANTLIGNIRKKLGLLESNQKTEWNAAEKELATAVAELGLISGVARAPTISTMIDSARSTATDADRDWKPRADAWKMVALAHDQNQLDKARTELESLANNPNTMEICWRGLAAIQSTDTNLAELKNTVCDKAMTGRLPAGTKTDWQIRKSQALSLSGDFKNARALLITLAKQKPKSLSIQLELARSATRLADNEAEAIGYWRALIPKVKPGTETWFESKYEIARLLSETGKKPEALKLLQYLKAVGPNWDESKLSKKFDSLLKQLR